MRQILFSNSKAIVARMPRPTPGPGTVVVRTRFSAISIGTEMAGLRPLSAGSVGATTGERVSDAFGKARHYLGKAARNPKLAVDRTLGILGLSMRRRLQAISPVQELPNLPVGPLRWSQEAAARLEAADGRLDLVSGGGPGHYQAASQAIERPAEYLVEIRLKGRVVEGGFQLGLLNADGSAWLGMVPLSAGELDETLHFDPGGSSSVTLMLTNPADAGTNRLVLEKAEATLVPAFRGGLSVTEMTDQGWNAGYSLSGEVVAVASDISDIAVGDLVACAGAGQANHADYVAVKRNLVCRVPEGCSLQEAATATIGSIALQGVRRAGPQLGETVCVIGLGLIGMITVQLLRAAGCRVIGHDLDAARCHRAVTLGAAVASADLHAVLRHARDLTDGHGVDATIITAATKSNGPVNAAMDLTRRRGRVVLVGDIGLKVERAAFYRKEIDLLMSTSYGPGRYDRAYEDHGQDYPFAYVRWTANRNIRAYMELIAARKIDIASMIDRVVPIEEASAAYADLAAGVGSAPLAVLLDYGQAGDGVVGANDATVIRLRGHRPAAKNKVSYALVGAGGFGTQMLVPMLERRKDRVQLRAVVSRDTARGGNFARSKQVELLSTDYDAILENDGIDAVVIATRHNEHASQVVKALRAGKHVFVEKPLATSWAELDQVRDTLAALDAPPRLMVGFNRRFSPALQRLREELGESRTPLVVNYRLHAGYIPGDHWVHGPEGGGRNIGEACHMYDVFALLTGAPVTSISATAIDPPSGAYNRNDNFVATLGYGDGSVCVLTYTALGPKSGLGKERIEVFANNEAWIVDDYRSLTRSGDGAVLWSASTADKGHAEELSRFVDTLIGTGPDPISVESLLETTAVALQVEDLLLGRSAEANG